MLQPLLAEMFYEDESEQGSDDESSDNEEAVAKTNGTKAEARLAKMLLSLHGWCEGR
jgi:hypothetical protein